MFLVLLVGIICFKFKYELKLLEKIFENVEVMVVFVGCVEFFFCFIMVFVWFWEVVELDVVLEVLVFVCFFFLLLGLSSVNMDYYEIGCFIFIFMLDK